MLIKSADDKSKRLALLDDLQKSPCIDHRQRDWLREESYRIKRGIAGERDAAHYLDNYLKDDPDRAILHDLRLSIDGAVIQIDHLVITRSLYVYLLETKNFNGDLYINELGEFSVKYSGERTFAIPSPLEQSRRHEGPLRKMFETLDIKGRNGGSPVIQHCVLVHPKSQIHRPPPNTFDSSHVIKADQFRAWHERFKDEGMGIGALMGSLLNIRSSDTIMAFAQRLARQHRPANALELPDFIQPRPPESAKTGKYSGEHVKPSVEPNPAPTTTAQWKAAPKTLVCATCGNKITFAEGKFCWNNERRFGGLQHCREHQASFR